MKINRVWAMPSKDTFTIKPIKELLQRYEVGRGWIDPFAGNYSPAEYTNDLNPDTKAICHTDEIKFEVVSSCENILKEVDKFITMIERLK